VALLADAGTHPVVTSRRGGRLSPTSRYVVGRVVSAFGTLLFVVLFNFFLFRVMPGDPVGLGRRWTDRSSSSSGRTCGTRSLRASTR